MIGSEWTISTFTDIGKREHQEDRLLCESIDLDIENGKGLMLAVMDGHCGDAVVNCVSSNLLLLFQESMMLCEGDIARAQKRCFDILQENCGEEVCGTTASMVYLPANHGLVAYIAYIGDSPVFFRTNKGKYYLNQLHNVSNNTADVSTIEAAQRHRLNSGDLYINSHGVNYLSRYLQLTRAIGDRYFGDILIREPAIEKQAFLRGSAIVLASDGIFVGKHCHDSCEKILQLVENGADARAVGEWVLQQDAHDNVSIIVAS